MYQRLISRMRINKCASLTLLSNINISCKAVMNIYTFLMAKDKGDTFFPKLNSIEQSKKRKVNGSLKKSNRHEKPDRNSSINDYKYRMTYHDILRRPPSITQKEPIPKIKLEATVRTSFVRSDALNSNSKMINQYEIGKQLGKGGFAEVFEAHDSKGGRFALKQYELNNSFECFRNECTVGEHFFQRGELRAEFAEKRGAKNVIAFIEKIKIGKKGYIIQEIGGVSLSKMLSEIKGIFYKGERVYQVQFTKFYEELSSKRKLNKLLIQIAEGIKLLNQEGFIHCDLKPENILVSEVDSKFHSEVDSKFHCKIIDFGSSFQRKKGLPKITITPQYMPPELLNALQTDNSSSSLSKVDVWSFGCILLQIVTGIPLWFRYKCKVEVKGRQTLQLGVFSLTNREYHKIIKKQKDLCSNLNKIIFTTQQFEEYRKVLKKVLVFEQSERGSIDEVLLLLAEMQ